MALKRGRDWDAGALTGGRGQGLDLPSGKWFRGDGGFSFPVMGDLVPNDLINGPTGAESVRRLGRNTGRDPLPLPGRAFLNPLMDNMPSMPNGMIGRAGASARHAPSKLAVNCLSIGTGGQFVIGAPVFTWRCHGRDTHAVEPGTVAFTLPYLNAMTQARAFHELPDIHDAVAASALETYGGARTIEDWVNSWNFYGFVYNDGEDDKFGGVQNSVQYDAPLVFAINTRKYAETKNVFGTDVRVNDVVGFVVLAVPNRQTVQRNMVNQPVGTAPVGDKAPLVIMVLGVTERTWLTGDIACMLAGTDVRSDPAAAAHDDIWYESSESARYRCNAVRGHCLEHRVLVVNARDEKEINLEVPHLVPIHWIPVGRVESLSTQDGIAQYIPASKRLDASYSTEAYRELPTLTLRLEKCAP